MDSPELLFPLLITTVGFIIGLGAVTVIDIHGILGKFSSYWRAAAVRTHKVTMPLIWLGSLLVGIGYALSSAQGVDVSWLWYIYVILILNGSFLSFVISPKLIANEKAGNPEAELPNFWQMLVILSTIISFSGWWSSLYIYLGAVLNMPQ
jgi:hypothetical protein